MSVPKYRIFSAEQTVFSDISAASFNTRVLTRDGADPEQLTTLDVTASFIPTLRLPLARGRNFTADEDKENGPHVCILSYDVWKTRFGMREDIVGSTIQIDGVGTTVVGVLAEGLPAPISVVQALWPWPFSPTFLTPAQRDAGAGYMQITARLKPGVTFSQAEAEVTRSPNATSRRIRVASTATMKTSEHVDRGTGRSGAANVICCLPPSDSCCSLRARTFESFSQPSLRAPQRDRHPPLARRDTAACDPAVSPRDADLLHARRDARPRARAVCAQGGAGRVREPTADDHNVLARCAHAGLHDRLVGSVVTGNRIRAGDAGVERESLGRAQGQLARHGRRRARHAVPRISHRRRSFAVRCAADWLEPAARELRKTSVHGAGLFGARCGQRVRERADASVIRARPRS